MEIRKLASFGGTLALVTISWSTVLDNSIKQPINICFLPIRASVCDFKFPGVKTPLPEPTTNYQGTTLVSSASSTASTILQGFQGILDVSSMS